MYFGPTLIYFKMNIKTIFIGLFFLFFIQFSYSQYRFEDGYYITQDGDKINCLIEKREWSNWSNESFNISQNGSLEQIKISEVSEFGIDGKLKFITKEVEIDKSSDAFEDLNQSKDFKFIKERVLLKVIAEGDLSLYLYLKDNIRKFFYKDRSDEVKQLKYKRYIDENFESGLRLKKVVDYKYQLREYLKCSSYDFSKLSYELMSLKKYVIEQNNCSDTKLTFITKRTIQPKLTVSGSIGFMFSNLDVTRSSKEFTVNAGGPSIGLDFDYLIPTIRGDMEINFRTYYNAFKSDDDIDFDFGSIRNVEIDYSEILIGVGGGYRFYLSNSTALSLNIGLNYPLLLNDTTYNESVNNSSLDLSGKEAKPFLSLGTSIYLKKFKITLEYLGKRNIMEGINNFKVDLSRFSFRVGYQIF